MAASPFAFFRGTFHLFVRDLLDKVCEPVPILTDDGVEMDLVGDIHSENYGTYKATDGQVHYDINDFDETTHGHFDFDVRRLATSLFLTARDRGDTLADSTLAALQCLTTYTESVGRLLKKGKAPDVDDREGIATGCPAVDALIVTAAAAKRSVFIGKLTEFAQGHRRLIRSLHYYNLPDEQREQARRLLQHYVSRLPEPPAKEFLEVEDVCGRVSGIGSMGRHRYVVLLAGKGSADARNVLLEFKEARPSAYDLYRQRETSPEALAGRAERVILVQGQSQAASNPWLGFAVDGLMSFQVARAGAAGCAARPQGAERRRPDARGGGGAGCYPGPHARPGRDAGRRPAETAGGAGHTAWVLPAGAGVRPGLRRWGATRLGAFRAETAPSRSAASSGPPRNWARASRERQRPEDNKQTPVADAPGSPDSKCCPAALTAAPAASVGPGRRPPAAVGPGPCALRRLVVWRQRLLRQRHWRA